MKAQLEINTWAQFKVILADKQLDLQYVEDDRMYDIYAFDSAVWHTIVLKGTADAIDFENNFKAEANKIAVQYVRLVDVNRIPIDLNNPLPSKLFDGNGNAVTVVADGGGVFLLRTYAKLAAGNSNVGYVGIVDKDGVNKANVTGQGSLEVYVPQPTPPPGTTEVRISATSSLSGTFADTFYTIPDGEVLVVQSFSGGAADSLKDSKVSLYCDPLGTGVDMELVRTAYVGNTNFDYQLGLSFPGNGVSRVVLRRRAIDSGPREIAGFWNGYRYTP